MLLGTEVGLDPEDIVLDIVLDGDQLHRGKRPCLLWPNGWID